jgi:NRPS condensation-like uncharacterized protein
VATIRQTFGLDINVTSIFEYPRLVDLANFIDHEVEKRGTSIVDLVGGRERPVKGPLSYSQELNWYLEDDPRSAKRRTTRLVEMEGRLDPSILESSLLIVVDENPILRTLFSIVEGRPVQVIHETPGKALEIVTPEAKSIADGWRAIDTDLQKINQESFNLLDGPALKATLFVLGAERHVLAIRISHLLCDLVGMDLLLDEVFRTYKRHYKTPNMATGDGPKIQFVDFAMWQHRMEAEKGFAAKAAYWSQKKCSNYFEEESWFNSKSKAVNTERLAVSEDRANKLVGFCRSEGVTVSTAFVAIFGARLLKQYNREKIVVDYVHSGRYHPAFVNLIGTFATAFPVEILRQDNEDLRSLVRSVKKELLRTNLNQYFPTHRLSGTNGKTYITFHYLPRSSPIVVEEIRITKTTSFDQLYGVRPTRDLNVYMHVEEVEGGFEMSLSAAEKFFTAKALQEFLVGCSEDVRALATTDCSNDTEEVTP